MNTCRLMEVVCCFDCSVVLSVPPLCSHTFCLPLPIPKTYTKTDRWSTVTCVFLIAIGLLSGLFFRHLYIFLLSLLLSHHNYLLEMVFSINTCPTSCHQPISNSLISNSAFALSCIIILNLSYDMLI